MAARALDVGLELGALVYRLGCKLGRHLFGAALDLLVEVVHRTRLSRFLD